VYSIKQVDRMEIHYSTLLQKGKDAKYKLNVFRSILTQCRNLEKSTRQIRELVANAEREIEKDLDDIIANSNK